MKTVTGFRSALICLASLGAGMSLFGQGDRDSRYIFGSDLELGGYWPQLRTEIRLDAFNGYLGTKVAFEKDLNFSNHKTLPFIQATWRFSKDWLVQADYVNLDRSSVHTLETEIQWPPGDEGEIYSVGAAVASFLDFESSRLAFAYIIQTKGDSELALVGGIHLTNMGAGIALAVDVNGNAGAVGEDVEFGPIPLPSVGLYWGVRVMDRLVVRIRGDFFYLKFDDYSGGLISTRLDGAYQFAKNWSIGAGLSYYEIAVDAKKPQFYGRMDFSYWGPSLYARYSF